MKILSMSFLLLLSIASLGQEKAPDSATRESPSWVPHPILFSGPSLVGNGYQAFALSGGGGLLLNSGKLLADFEGGYMNARKTNDGTLNNRKGHERYLDGRIFYKYRRSFYFGGGAQWSETSTTNYTKKAWRPTAGVGGDYFSERFSCRWQTLYISPGTDWQNGVQGAEFQLWMPSPASKSHFFYRQSLGVYEFHTVTDRTDQQLTGWQRGQRDHAGFLDFAVGWRF